MSGPKPTVTARIKPGASISIDMAYFRWPHCYTPRCMTEIDPRMEFKCEWSGRYWDCSAYGFGIHGTPNGDGYGSGSIFVFDHAGIEPLDGSPLPAHIALTVACDANPAAIGCIAGCISDGEAA